MFFLNYPQAFDFRIHESRNLLFRNFSILSLTALHNFSLDSSSIHILLVFFPDHFYAIFPSVHHTNFQISFSFLITFAQFFFCFIFQIFTIYFFSFLVTFTWFIFCNIIKIFKNCLLSLLITFMLFLFNLIIKVFSNCFHFFSKLLSILSVWLHHPDFPI